MARTRKEKEPEAREPRNFEQDLQQLEEIVGALEEGGLSLDDALKHFERGIGLARACEKALTDAEKKIEILTRTAQGTLEARPFDAEGDADAPPLVFEDEEGDDGEEGDEKDLLF